MGVALVLVGASIAQDRDAGTTAFAMLGLSYDAREIAMADASIGMSSGIYGFYGNPAAMAYLDRIEVAVGYRSSVSDAWGGLLTFGMPLRKTGFWAVSLVNLSEGDIPEVLGVDVNGDPIESGRTYGANGLAGSLSWGRVLWRQLAVGLTIKGLYHYIGSEAENYSSDGYAVDAGVQYRWLRDRLILGAAVRNLGAVRESYSENVEAGDLPATFGVGLSYNPKYMAALRFALDVEATNGLGVEIQPGAEVAILKDLLFVRAGFAFTDRDLGYFFDNLSGEAPDNYDKTQWDLLCLGLGVDTDIATVNVAGDAAVVLNTTGEPSVAISIRAGF